MLTSLAEFVISRVQPLASAKLVNILGGYGYSSSLASLERCIDSAVAGKVL